jgi:flagellar motor switch protein FliM
MTLSLSEQQLASLLSLAQSREQARSANTNPAVEKIVFGTRPPLTADQTNSLTQQSESIATRLSKSLSALLRVDCQVKSSSIDKTGGTQLLKALPASTYVASLASDSPPSRILVHLDLSLALPLIDLLFGGPGTDPVEPRDLTEIEEAVFDSIPKVVANELQNTWSASPEMDIHFAQRETSGELVLQPSLAEEFVCLRFTISFLQNSGSLTVLFPERLVDSVLRKPPSASQAPSTSSAHSSTARIRELVLNARFEVQLSLPKTPLRLSELLALEPGQVIVLQSPIQSPIELWIGRHHSFRAFPIRQGSRKGARIVSRVPATDFIPPRQEAK